MIAVGTILGQGQELFSGARRRKGDRAERRIGDCGFGKLVSCGGSGERGRRTELDLCSRKSLDDHHAAATFGTEPRWTRFPGRGGFWFSLRWLYSSECQANARHPWVQAAPRLL